MSTNAVIKVAGSNVCLYKHWDGDPEATLGWLEEFNTSFAENRGDDHEYKVAQLVRSSVTMSEQFNLDQSEYTGWGLFVDDGRIVEFMYLLNVDGTITITRE